MLGSSAAASTPRPLVLLRLLLLLGLLVTGTAVVAPSATAAVGAPVLIDDFGGLARGRTVTPLPLTDTSTTPQGTFTESGGKGTLVATGNGNGQAGVQLDYDFPALDLTSGVSNSQFFLEFDSIQRTPEVIGESSILVAIDVTDSNGATGSYSTGLGNVTDFNVVLNFYCEAGQTTCFEPQIDFTHVTHVRVTLLYPRNYDDSHTLTAVLDTIRTTPPGGVAPPPPSPQVEAPSGNPVYGLSGSTVQVPIRFRSQGDPVAVTASPVTQEGLRAEDVVVTGSATGASNVSVSGGPSDYVATLGPITGSGSVTVSVPASAVVDAWGQDNTAGSASFTFQVAVPPSAAATRTLPDAPVGTAYSQSLSATGTPSPTWTVTGGTVPPGLTLGSGGTLSGTPTATGSYTFTATATNVVGTASQAVSVRVVQAPAITSLDTATFNAGEAGSFTVTTTGYPAPALSVESGTLPPGLALTDNGDGTATLAGTPTGAAGTRDVGLLAQSSAGSAHQTLTVRVQAQPVFVSPGSATFTRGSAGSFTVDTDGFPDAVIGVSAGTLPAGLTLTDNGNGTATLAGTPTGALGTTSVEVRAENTRGFATQTLTIAVNGAPSISSAAAAAFEVGTAGSFTVSAGGYPAPALTVGTLPPGLTFTDHGDGTGTIAGTASAPGGSSTVAVTATNTVGTASQQLTVTVSEEPAVTAAATAAFVVGQAGSFEVGTTGYPSPTLTIDAVPAGLAFTDHGDGTATLAGTPTGTPGTLTTTVTATNAVGTATHALAVVVRSRPAVTSAAAATFDVGQPGSFTISASGSPTPAIAAIGALPVGLTLTDHGNGTATLGGTPTTAGARTVTVRATNAAGLAEQDLVVTVRPAAGPPPPGGAPPQCAGVDATIVAGDTQATVVGTDGVDVIMAGTGTTLVLGGGGDDVICAAGDDVVVRGGPGNDTIRGGSRLVGGTGDDDLAGWSGDDVVLGGAGDDVLAGNLGDDRLAGGTGNDTLEGHRGADRVGGGAGDDVVSGGRGQDQVRGGAGDDHVVGAQGDDDCAGGQGLDTASTCEVLAGVP